MRRCVRPFVLTLCQHATRHTRAPRASQALPETAMNADSQVRETLPAHLVATLFRATSDCLHSCLMALPVAYHSLVTGVHHPATPPAHIAHLTSSQLACSPRWASSEENLLRLCKEATSTRCLSVLLASFDDGSYFLLRRNPGLQAAACKPSWPVEAPELCTHVLESSQRAPSLKLDSSNCLLFETAVCCLSGVQATTAPETRPAAREVAEVLPNLQHLQALELRTASKQDVCRNLNAVQVQRTLELCTGLRSLTIRGVCSEHDCKSVSPLVPALLQLEHLTSLALIDHSITSQTLSDLQENVSDPAMPLLPNLKSLNLSRNRLWYLGVYPLHSLLTQLTTIEDLDLSGSLLGIEIFGRYALSDAFRALTNLRVIRMSSNRLHGEVLRPLSRAWSTLCHVEHLDLQGSCVRYTVDTAVSLSRFSGLQHLNLSGATQNDVSSWSILTPALLPLTHLTQLSLRSCQLTSASMGLLLPSIASCSDLLTLDLSGNEMVTSQGIQCLSEHLCSFPLLKALLLSGFDVSGEGASALAVSLPSCRLLSRLDLGGLCTCDRAVRKLRAVASSVAEVTLPKIIGCATDPPFPDQSLRIPFLHVG